MNSVGKLAQRVRGAVALGGSAGGVQALVDLLAAVPADAGLAWLVAQHLDARLPSQLVPVLQRATRMPVVQADEGVRLRPDTVHVLAPGTTLTVDGAVLRTVPRPAQKMPAHPVDALFHSLARSWGPRAAGVVLSGTGDDGAAGVRALRAAGAWTAVQLPASATFAGMPEAALATGEVDCVDTPQRLPMRLLDAWRERAPAGGATAGREAAQETRPDDTADAVKAILARLRTHRGYDLSLYKRSTLLRRIRRRMDLHRLDSMVAYERLLAQSESELDLLGREVLIGVTAFFRDRDVWQALGGRALPALLAAREDGTALRAWVAGCSTGEEAYSLAIAFREAVEAMPSRAHCSLQIFATDLNADAIARARRGVYQGALRGEVSPRRLARFFVPVGDGWRIAGDIRETVVFAPHDVNRDPPFTRLDLISCRNLLIYLTAPLQRRLMPVFHYGLRPDGLLLLGSSESIGRFEGLFDTLDARLRIYRRRAHGAGLPMPELAWRLLPAQPDPSSTPGADVSPANTPPSGSAESAPTAAADAEPAGALRDDVTAPAQAMAASAAAPACDGTNPTGRPAAGHAAGGADLAALAGQWLQARYAPPAVLVGERGDILYIHGRTGRFLEPAAGRANWNVLSMARAGLREALAEAMRQAATTHREAETPELPLEAADTTPAVRLQVTPLDAAGPLAGMLLVVFHALESGAARGRRRVAGPVRRDLEFDLQHAREEAQSLREEMRASQEELQAANEELQSTNEELQSTNEELTSSKEAMQSMNEELQAVNAELHAKLDDLAVAHSDIRNLLNSTDVATLFLDRELHVRRFTERARRLISLRDGDAGRPVSELTTSLDYPQLEDDVREMLRTLLPCERQVHRRDGRRYAVRILPYRTQDEVIDGAVLTFMEIATPADGAPADEAASAHPVKGG